MTTIDQTITPASQLADLIGTNNARIAIEAGWRAIRELNSDQTTPSVHPGVADYVATVSILAAVEAGAFGVDDMYKRAYFDVQAVLDEAIGSDGDSGGGEGIAADVRLLAQRYADLKATVIAPGRSFSPAHWQRIIGHIESLPLRCSHGTPVDEDCGPCLADVARQLDAANGGENRG